jgi:2-polyprenyl-3-methyl-5-hydroxy-6-metoxy-1,4-benzoquinol methylase
MDTLCLIKNNKGKPISFTEKFCREFMIKEAGETGVLELPDSFRTIKALKEKLEGKAIVLIDSETVITGGALKRLTSDAGGAGADIIVPLVNSEFQDQSVAIPFVFHDIPGFRKASLWVEAHGNGTLKSEKVSDKICFLTSDFLKQLPDSMEICDLFDSRQWKCAEKRVSGRALAHVFSDYFAHAREDLAVMVNPQSVRILDVGCGQGNLGRYLRSKNSDILVHGVEPDPWAGKRAAEDYHAVFSGKLEEFHSEELFDTIICGDVLEHLYDPWTCVTKLVSMLKMGGEIIGTCPNSGHWSVVNALLDGSFDYIPAGILCFDHIRFFTEKSLKQLLVSAGLQIDVFHGDRSMPDPETAGFIKEMEKFRTGASDKLLVHEFRFRAVKVRV